MNIKNNIYTASLRLDDWLHVLGLPILGIAYYSISSLLSYKAIWGLTISSLYLAHGYSLNTCFDAKVEKYWHQILSSSDPTFFKKILLFSYALFLINCMLSFPYSLAIFYLVLIGSLSALIYSARPLRLKSFLFTNIFLNSFGFSLLFMIGFVSASNNITFSCLLMTALFAIIFIPLQIIHNLSHAEMEQRTNLKTTPDLYKLKTMLYFFNIALVLILLWLLIMVLFLENKYILLFLPTAPFVLSLFYLMRKLNMADTSTAIKARVLLRKICILYGLALLFILPLLG